MSDSRRRLSAELTEESAIRLQAILPHGWQKPLMQAIVDQVIKMYDTHGIQAVAGIVAGQVDVVDFTRRQVDEK